MSIDACHGVPDLSEMITLHADENGAACCVELAGDMMSVLSPCACERDTP